ncbi:MAG: RNB domain-containing ribonuclease [Thermoanaerobaculia bacterium]
MLDRGLDPEFSREAGQELDRIKGPARESGAGVRDLRNLLWCSIDNDDSRDLDQLSVSETLPGGAVRISVAIADVDAVVKKTSAIDDHARNNTTSVYTAAEIFPMLPERLSTDLTSLNQDEERIAFVVAMTVAEDGSLLESDVFRATVRNRAKLAYDSVAAWLEGEGPAPGRVADVPGLADQLRAQDTVAQKLKRLRHERGSLDLETLEPRVVFQGETIVGLSLEKRNPARELIEEFMIAANGVTARTLDEEKVPSLRRVVRSPERWQKIVGVAAGFGESLPPEPDAKALEAFLSRRNRADPLRFPDLSLVIVKLMGRGEYVVERPGGAPVGHFGLAVRDYTHSTAPNRRFPDLLTQRLLKAAMAGQPVPYDGGELEALATHCTEKEDDANKVERQVRKSAGALLLERRVGDRFDAIVTGASDKGTWVRLLDPPVEGKLVHGFEGLSIGKKIRVKLISTDVERGFLDFMRAG